MSGYRKERLQEWDAALGHTELDGPPGVWKHKSMGNRCAFNAIWITSTGLVRPDHLLPVELMTDLQLRYSIEDFNSQGDWMSAQGLMALLSKQEGWRQLALKAVIRCRKQLHEEWLAWWDPPHPDTIVYPPKCRTSWGKPSEEPEPVPVVVKELVKVVDRPPPMPKEPTHPNQFRSKSEITPAHYNKHDERMRQYKLDLDDWVIQSEKWHKKHKAKK